MKYFLFVTAISFSLISKSQSIILKSIYSNELKDSIRYRVWLPQGFTKDTKHTAIYTVEDTEDGILFGCASFGMSQKYVPNTIVIGILKGREYIDFNFVTGIPNSNGLIFLKELTSQIIPDVEKEFGSSVYKAFMGHSYSATYGNYLMLHHPGIFKGYILFAPERYWNDETKPEYVISDSIANYYNRNTTFVYLAVGEDDEKRRKDYVKEIQEKVKKINTNTFHFQSEIVPGSHHGSIVPNKMDAALWNIFRAADDFKNIDSVANVLQYFNDVQQKMNDVFGIDIPKDTENSSYFYKLAAKNKDEAALKKLMGYFPVKSAPGGKGLDYCNMAYTFLHNGWKEKAEEFYLKAIETATEEQKVQFAGQNIYNIEMASRNLAFKIYTADPKKGWKILSGAVTVTKHIATYFNIGRLAVEKKMHLKEGIIYLETALLQKDSEDFAWFQEEICQYLGEAYALMGNKKKSVAFAKQALSLNPNNEKAKKLLL